MSQGIGNVTIDIEELLKNVTNSAQSKPTIFKVDDYLRRVSKKDYEPDIVSIGPIHHGKDHVKSMEPHKVRFLHQFLQERAGLTVEMIVEELRKMEVPARRCYPESLNLASDKFLKILLLDGCFIIQLIRKYYSYLSSEPKDPIFEHSTISRIRYDLMLFENQLPFFVLSHLFDMIKTKDPDDNLCDFILFFVENMLPWSFKPKYNPSLHKTTSPDHLLSLVHTCISAKFPSESNGEEFSNSTVLHNSASVLKEVGGIRLKGSERLTFVGRVLEIPPLRVTCKTRSFLRNLMAYEQLQLADDHPKIVTDYVFFMQCLIRSSKDIEILRHSGIITNHLGGDDKIVPMLERLVLNFMISSKFCHSSIFVKLNDHCEKRMNKWMAKLRRTHFDSPWSVTKFVAATLLLLLTIAQTVFSVLSFLYRKN